MRALISRLMCTIGAFAAPALAAAQTTPPARFTRFTAGGQALSEFEIMRDSTVAHGGRTSIRVRAQDEPSAFANISTVADAKEYVGHQIRFSVFLKSASLGGGGAQLWARADDANRRSIAFFNSVATTSFGGTKEWTQMTISLDIPPSAVSVYLGILSLGAGTLWIDDASVVVGLDATNFGFETPDEFTPPRIQYVAATREPPRAVTDRGLANLTAFANALGYVRFFQPTDAAVHMNWDALAVHGVRAVEGAPSPDSLASALAAVFAPVTGNVTFARTGAALPTSVAKPADATHVVYWRHIGAGAPSGGTAPNPQNLYRSERVAAPLSSVGQPVLLPAQYGAQTKSVAHVPDPSRALVVSLGGGVSMSIPVAIYSHDSTIAETLRLQSPSPVTERFIAADRATRLADVALAWSLFEHFYPYFDVVHTDWPAALNTALRSAATDIDGRAFDVTIQRLVAALHDGHGGANAPTRGLSSPDVRLGWAEGRVIVTAVGDSAAAKGVKVGDEVVSLDGRPIKAELADRSTRISGATEQWIRSRALTLLLVGDLGSVARVGLKGADGSSRDVALSRSPGVDVKEKLIEKIGEVSPGVMYVDIGRITDADFDAALPKLVAAKSVIFDMRTYPRSVSTPRIFAHLTDTLIHSAHFMVPIITMPKFQGVGYVDGAWDVKPVAPRIRGRIVFLSSGGSISYAESTLGIVEAYKLADIVGEPSAGTNGNVNPFALPGGYQVTWTGMLVQKRDGTPHHGVGVVPTVLALPTVAGIRAGRDDVLERAIALVNPRALTP